MTENKQEYPGFDSKTAQNKPDQFREVPLRARKFSFQTPRPLRNALVALGLLAIAATVASSEDAAKSVFANFDQSPQPQKPQAQSVPGAWYPDKKMPAENYDFGYTFDELGNNFYVAGGANQPTYFWKYNLQTLTWETKANIPLGTQASALISIGNNILKVNGRAYSPETGYYATNKTWFYTDNNWTEKAPTNFPTSYHSIVKTENGDIIKTGGNEVMNKAEKYNVATNTWTILPDISCHNILGHQSVSIGNSKLLLIGGNSSEVTTNKVVEYNFQNGDCRQVGTLAVPRQGMVIWKDGNNLILNGGYRNDTHSSVQEQESFSLLTYQSTLLEPNPPSAKSLLGGGKGADNKGRLIGGVTSYGLATKDQDIYDPNPPAPSATPTKTATNVPVVSPSPTKTPEAASPTPTTPKNPVTPQPNSNYNLAIPNVPVNQKSN